MALSESGGSGYSVFGDLSGVYLRFLALRAAFRAFLVFSNAA
jgi:hypothetical protein